MIRTRIHKDIGGDILWIQGNTFIWGDRMEIHKSEAMERRYTLNLWCDKYIIAMITPTDKGEEHD